VERDSVILAIGPDSREAFAEYWKEHDMPFIGLPDPDHSVAEAYRQEVNLLKLGRMPAVLIVDRQGRIQYQHYGRSMSDIPANSALFEVLDGLDDATPADG